MYEDFLKAILLYVEALNAVDVEIEPIFKDGLTPLLGNIPVMLDGEVVGELRDELGGCWSYHDKADA